MTKAVRRATSQSVDKQASQQTKQAVRRKTSWSVYKKMGNLPAEKRKKLLYSADKPAFQQLIATGTYSREGENQSEGESRIR